jgi:tRNA-modifying protein YgfZ
MLVVDYDRLGVLQWLGRLGASTIEDAYGIQAVFGSPQSGLPPNDKGAHTEIYPLSDLGLIQVSGAEAVKFLHAQLTNDLEKLQDSQWRWFGYCNAKGRMQLSAAGYKRADLISLIASRPLAAPLAKRLGMFVMRAKAKVQDASANYEIYGLQGDIALFLNRLGVKQPLPEPGGSMRIDWAKETLDLLTIEPFAQAGLPGLSQLKPRYLLVAPAGSKIWQEALAADLRPAHSAWWRASEVASASARIVPATYELFVPQMLNFESLGGVDFKKGCYPGQEVVARSQYLGKLKRRMFVAHLVEGAEAGTQARFEPQPAQDIWANSSNESQEPCGQVVLAATRPGTPVQVLFEAQTGAVELGKVGLRDLSGQWYALEVRPLPYPLLEI